MEAVVLSSNSKKDLALIIELAKKIGVSVQTVDSDDWEDIALLSLMQDAKTNEYVDTDKFIQDLTK